jgi:hypothetical protein
MDGGDPLAHCLELQGHLPSREGSNLLLEPLPGLLPGNGIQVLRVGPAAALGGRQALAGALLPLVAQDLDALAHMDDPPLLRMPLDSQCLPEKPLGHGQGPPSFFPRPTQPDEVVRPAREPEAFLGHPSVERRQEDVGPQRTCDPTLGHASQRGFPAPALHPPYPQHVSREMEDAAVTDVLGDQVDEL